MGQNCHVQVDDFGAARSACKLDVRVVYMLPNQVDPSASDGSLFRRFALIFIFWRGVQTLSRQAAVAPAAII